VDVEHVDFVSVPVTDMERSTAWYRDTLGLPQTGDGGFPEFELGDNAFLYLLSMDAIGSSFQGPHTAALALRVPDVAETRTELDAPGIAFFGETFDQGVCHMASFADPAGNVLMLRRRYAPQES